MVSLESCRKMEKLKSLFHCSIRVTINSFPCLPIGGTLRLLVRCPSSVSKGLFSGSLVEKKTQTVKQLLLYLDQDFDRVTQMRKIYSISKNTYKNSSSFTGRTKFTTFLKLSPKYGTQRSRYQIIDKSRFYFSCIAISQSTNLLSTVC